MNKTERKAPTHICMVDIETYDTAVTAKIVEIAAVIVRLNEDGTLSSEDVNYWSIGIAADSQDNVRTVSPETLLWWNKQGGIERHSSYMHSLQYGLFDFVGWLASEVEFMETIQFWSKGNFDFPILEHAMKQNGVSVPWKYWQLMDLRTAQALVPSVIPAVADIPHVAISDCFAQTKTLAEILGAING